MGFAILSGDENGQYFSQIRFLQVIDRNLLNGKFYFDFRGNVLSEKNKFHF